MEPSTLGILIRNLTSERVLEFSSGQMARSTSVYGTRVKPLISDDLPWPMETATRVNGKKIKLMGMQGPTTMPMALATMGNGRRIVRKDSVLNAGQMEVFTPDSIMKAKNMESDRLPGLMAQITRVSGCSIRCMALAFSTGLMGVGTREST